MPISYRDDVNIPDELLDLCSNLIKEQKDLGYHNLSEFIVDTVKRRIAELQKEKRETKSILDLMKEL
jgi:metal-responsive CopG/Arc/MetJ family transcriptional regulator